MKSTEVSFHDYLRREVEKACMSYECARRRVFALTGTEEIQPGPELLQATAAMSDEMKTYIGALRRLAHYAAHQAQAVPQREFAAHG